MSTVVVQQGRECHRHCTYTHIIYIHLYSPVMAEKETNIHIQTSEQKKKKNKKHLKNVGPIRHCEPPHAAGVT